MIRTAPQPGGLPSGRRALPADPSRPSALWRPADCPPTWPHDLYLLTSQSARRRYRRPPHGSDPRRYPIWRFHRTADLRMPPPSATLLPSDHVPLRDTLVISPYSCAPVFRTLVSPMTPSPAPVLSMLSSAPLTPTPIPTDTRFITALILPSADQSGALAIIDHAGELILHAALPEHLHHDVSDPEGLLAHLIHFVPCLSAITDILVSLVPGATAREADTPLPPPVSNQPPSSVVHLLPLIAWLGPRIHVVPPATWLANHGIAPGAPEPLRLTCARSLPGLLPLLSLPRVTDAVRAAVLLAFSIRLEQSQTDVDCRHPG